MVTQLVTCAAPKNREGTIEMLKAKRPPALANLTKRYIDQATYIGDGTSRDVRWDTSRESPQGFGLRVYPSGKKSFVISFRQRGRKHLKCIGMYGRLTLDEARREGKKQIAAIVSGNDVLAARNAKTIRDLCAYYQENFSTPQLKKSWREEKRLIDRHILPEWGALKVKEITYYDVLSFHKRLGQKSIYTANRVHSLLSAMFECARRHEGFLGMMAQNPALGVKHFPEVKRDRWLRQEEAPRLKAAIDEEPNVYIRTALWLYLLTGLRKSELLRARWPDFDPIRKVLVLPDTKSGKPRIVPLTDPAIALIQALPRVADNPHIFVGHIRGKHLVGIYKPWFAVRKRAELPDLRLHDLRRTVGSWLAQTGSSLHVISHVLGHSNTATTAAVYARLGQEHVRTALEQHGRAIVDASNQGDDKVI